MTESQCIGELMQEVDEHAERNCAAMCNAPMEPVEEFRNAILAAFRVRGMRVIRESGSVECG